MKGRRNKDADINLGLAISGALLEPHAHRTLEEIAAYCGVSKTAIENIERIALRKMRIRLRQKGLTNAEVQVALRSFSQT